MNESSEHPDLPIAEILPELLDRLETSNSVVLHAPTGAGKTTRVPPAIWNAGLSDNKQIIMLEPRRIAARAAARRIADEMGNSLGGLVGYQVRFDSRKSRETKLLTVTDGILLRRLQDDPFLEEVGAVVFDEFHERGLESDVCLAMVRCVQQTIRPDLKIVVMSATLAAEPISEYLGNCPVVNSEGRQYPVTIEYVKRRDQRRLEQQIAAHLPDILDRTPGDVLIFLPGVGEIFNATRELESLAAKRDLKLLQLYGNLPLEKQDEVLSPCSQRKVVLATNVAESSLTIDGVTGVIDSGLARSMQFNHDLGLDRLELVPISQASADQRTGRAGRTAPGYCLRLWEQAQHRHRPEHETAEIHRVDLSGVFLQLKVWGETDLGEFPWFEPPQEASAAHAEQLLERLGALDETGPTVLGISMSRFPVSPRLARLLIEGHRRGIPDRIATLAALLSERDPFRVRHRGRGKSSPRDVMATHNGRSDVLERLEAFEAAMAGRPYPESFGDFNRGTGKNIERIAQQLRNMIESQLGEPVASHGNEEQHILQALLAAYPDRLAKRRQAGKPNALMVGGRGVQLAPLSVVREADLFLCIDVDDKSANAKVRLASGVEQEWLPEELLETRDEVFFHPTQQQLMGRRRTYWDDLKLDESPIPVPDNEATEEALFRAACGHWDRIFPKEQRAFDQFVARVQSLHEWCPELELPTADEELIKEVLRDLCRTCRSFDDLRKSDWLGMLQSRFDYSTLQQIEQLTPTRWQAPSGKSYKLEYEAGKPPVLAIRIQELFGQRETPTIANGRVPLQLHLLAPNMRPQQITDDLTSFWENTYPQVRKDLRRRYSKHAWPEDPLAKT
ncbi:MAG: ATP-dependent helicase HrpB [Planctomycetaceae bacterium]|nr:ATP-dependent helicase HrpB [Planctomycetaceae bacterium]